MSWNIGVIQNDGWDIGVTQNDGNAETDDADTFTENNNGVINILIRRRKQRRKIMAKLNYPVSDVWLRTRDSDAPEYCDIVEIRNDPRGNKRQPDNALRLPAGYPYSAYIDWVIKNDPKVFTLLNGKAPAAIDHIIAAQFTSDYGCRIGDTDDGNNVRGVLLNSAIITVGEFFGGVDHDETYRRIYRTGTTVEKFWFLGC